MSLHLVILSGVILEQETHTILNIKSFIHAFKVPKLYKQSFLRYEKRKDNLVILVEPLIKI